jgi:hypothetical protein
MTDFEEVVKRAWDLECPNSDPVQIWQCKIRNLRRKIKGWNRNREVEIRKIKKCLVSESDNLDLVAEYRPLSDSENVRKKEVSLKLEQIYKNEEIKARQRAREKRLNRDIKILPICLLKQIREEGDFFLGRW